MKLLDYERALRLNPKMNDAVVKVYRNRYRIYQSLGQMDKAKSDIELAGKLGIRITK